MSEYRYIAEFGYELMCGVAYANWLIQNGKIKKTQSVKDTKSLYFFSPCHEELDISRRYKNNYKGLPRGLREYVSNRKINTHKWLPPDYKSYYKNDEFIFDKPILIVANKYLKDPWANNKIMNNINLNTLEWIFDNYKENYEIIYNRMSKENNLTFQDRELCKKYNIKMLENIIKTSYNITQVKLYANAKKFISVQGGQAVLCSYFGGTNIILSQTGKDVKHKDFYKTYPRLSGAKIIWEKEIKELKKRIKENL